MKKGFTLIELLAVIVILAIIALIAAPIILNIIESVRIRAAVQSAYGYVDAVNYRMAKDKLSSEQISDATYDILETDLKAKYDGTGPTHGTVTILKSSVKEAKLCIMGYPITYENGKAYHDKESKVCPGVDSSEEEKDVWDGKTVSESLNGCGTEESPFLIKSAADLIYMRNQVNSNGTISLLDTNCGDSAVTSAKTASYKQTISIALNDTKNYSSWNDSTTGLNIWESIGNYDNQFGGVYDGAEYTISGIYMPSTTSAQGLFGYVTSPNGATVIKNVNITKSYYSGNGTGTLVNWITHNASITIDNCTSDVEIVATSGTVGGIIAKVESTTTAPLTISNSSYNGKITNANFSGGLIGQFNSSSNGLLVINDSKNTANISGTDKFGGLIGSFIGKEIKINDSYNSGNIDGSGDYVGGIVGYLQSSESGSKNEFTNVYNNGKISADEYVGGLIGSVTNNYTNFNSSYNLKDVKGYKWVGGLIGYSSSSSLNLGTNNDTLVYNKGKVLGTQYVGGLVGHSVGVGTIYGYNTGNITIINVDNQTVMPSSVGGLIGHVDSQFNANNSYNTGDIIEQDATGKMNSGAIGGIVGHGNGGMVLTNVYNTGNINTSSFEYVGGLAGFISGQAVATITYNAGNITVPETVGTSVDNDFFVGGLIGKTNAIVISTYNYNLGNININVGSNENYLSGIVGYGNVVTMVNSHNTGTMINSNTGQNVVNYVSGISYSVPSNLVNSSYLSTTAQHGFASTPTNTGATSVSSVGSMPSVFSVLSADSNSIFKEDTNNINNGYPILSYQ